MEHGHYNRFHFKSSFFTIVGSKLLRRSSKYQVVVTPHNVKEPVTLQLRITNTGVNIDNSSRFEREQNVTIAGVTPKIVEFDVS